MMFIQRNNGFLVPSDLERRLKEGLELPKFLIYREDRKIQKCGNSLIVKTIENRKDKLSNF
jgi:hypothetical protein